MVFHTQTGLMEGHMSVIVELSIFPMSTQSDSLSPYVARALDIIKMSGLPYQLGPMGTCFEGEWNDVLAVVDACYKELEKDCDRIYVNFKADSRAGRTDGLTGKTKSVREKQR